MRILWLSHLVPYPPKAGVIQRSYHLLKQLALENEVDLLAFNQAGLMRPIFTDADEGLAEARRELSRFCNILGIFDIPCDNQPLGQYRLAFNSLFSPGGYNDNWLNSPVFRHRLNECLRDTAYDLVHMDTISFAPYYPIVRGKATVLDHHNIESHMMARRAGLERNPLRRAYFSLEAKRLTQQEQSLCAAVDLNITCSDVDSDRLREHCPDSKVVTIPNGVDTDYYVPHRTDSPSRLIFIGSMGWYPNIQAVEFIIENLSGPIAQRFPGLQIDIIGGGAPKSLSARAEGHPNVNFHGFVDDIRPYMNRALAFLCPITDGGGTKLKILDALAMGLPVVAHPIACEGIEVTDHKNVLFASTTAEYLDQLSILSDDMSFAKAISRSARQLVLEQFSVNAIGKDLRAEYQRLADLRRLD